MRDCIIIGSGPAGLTAALYLARFLRDVLVFDDAQGRARTIPKTHNPAPFPDGISGKELITRMRLHAQQYGALLERATVSAIEKPGPVFHVTTERGVEAARTVVLATYVVNHPPPLSASDHDLGLRRGLIRYCPVCDAYEVRGKRVAVLGKGSHGTGEARFLRQYTADLTLIPADGGAAGPDHDPAILARPWARASAKAAA